MTRHSPRLPADLAAHMAEHVNEWDDYNSRVTCKCGWSEGDDPALGYDGDLAHAEHSISEYELKYRKLCECGHARSGHGMDQETYVENGLGVCKVMQWPDGHGMPRKCACMAYSAKKRVP
jgi:hypothetical protein